MEEHDETEKATHSVGRQREGILVLVLNGVKDLDWDLLAAAVSRIHGMMKLRIAVSQIAYTTWCVARYLFRYHRQKTSRRTLERNWLLIHDAAARLESGDEPIKQGITWKASTDETLSSSLYALNDRPLTGYTDKE
jgi:hypothetical protein